MSDGFNGRPGGRTYDQLETIKRGLIKHLGEEIDVTLSAGIGVKDLTPGVWSDGCKPIAVTGRESMKNRTAWDAHQKRECIAAMFEQAAKARHALEIADAAVNEATKRRIEAIEQYRQAVDRYNKAIEEFAFKKV